MRFEPLPISSLEGAFLIGFSALFSIVNPIGSALIFFNLTASRSHAERLVMARKVAFYALLILLGSLWLGSYILNLFGVSLGALRVGGGLVVTASAWGLLMGADTRPAPDSESGTSSPDPGKDIVFFPLTMPFTTGPGSISVAIALASERPAEGEGTLTFFAGLTLAAITIAAVVWAVYAFADRVLRRFGEGGIRVVGRLSAFLLLCIGVQIIGSHPP